MISCGFRMARIMIVDDSEAIRNLLKDILLVGKHEVVAEAVNGIDAIEKFSTIKPDVVLLDVAMPKKDGLTALKEIKKTNQNAKVIMVTVRDEMDMIQDCVAAGASAYIIKPFDTEDVLKSISFVLDEN